MNAVILAAGTGSRLVNLTRDLPKALVEVGGQPLIDFTLQFARNAGSEVITVVGGFYFEKLRTYLNAQHPDVYVLENPDFLKGNILSLTAALDQQAEAFVLLNVDHIYPSRLAAALREKGCELESITAFVDFDRPLGPDDMKVALSGERGITKISKNLHEFDAGYIGMTYIPTQALSLYRSATKAVTRAKNDAVVEDILQWVSDHEKPVAIFDASGIRWLEVDNQRDLLNANRILTWVSDFLE
jgi:choline kinase